MKTSSPVKDIEASDMANVADVLTELKSLHSGFSLKLDRINNQLGELTNTISVMQNNLGEINRDVTANEQRSLYSCYGGHVGQDQLWLKQQSGSHTWKKTQRTWKTAGGGKISGCLVSRREPRVRVLFWTL